MALEGLVVPDDFADFAEKEDLESLFKLLLKPAKIAHGAHGALREIASYAIPAKSQIRLDGARKAVLYYNLVGRPLEPADMGWPVIKNFVEQWKALTEKKTADAGKLPFLTKDKLVYKWIEQMNQYLDNVIGVRNAPYTYLTRPDANPPAILAARAVNQPYSGDYESIEHEMKFCVTHNHTLGKADNSALFYILEKSVQGHDVAATIAPFKRTADGRGAYLAIKNQHAGRSVWDQVVKDATATLQTSTWTGTTSITLLQHTSLQRRAYIMLTEAAEQVPAEIPGPRQRTTYLLDSLKTDDPKMLAGMAAIAQDETGKRVNFENSVTYLLPSDPVAAKKAKAKGLAVNVSGAAVIKPAGGFTKGATGVELRWHEPKHFATLSKEQKKELQVWNSNQPKVEGGRKRKSEKAQSNEKWKKARVASTKATTTLMEAMSTSHDAQMELMNVKIASMVSGVAPIVSPPQVKVGAVGAGVSFHPGVYGPPPVFGSIDPCFAAATETARVAALNLKNILKPPSKKSAP